MDESDLSLLLMLTALFVVAFYSLFFWKGKKQDWGKPILYFLLAGSSVGIIWEVVSLSSAYALGVSPHIGRPNSFLFIGAIIVLCLYVVDVFFLKRMRGPRYSKFLNYFALVFSSGVVIWGLIVLLVTRV